MAAARKYQSEVYVVENSAASDSSLTFGKAHFRLVSPSRADGAVVQVALNIQAASGHKTPVVAGGHL